MGEFIVRWTEEGFNRLPGFGQRAQDKSLCLVRSARGSPPVRHHFVVAFIVFSESDTSSESVQKSLSSPSSCGFGDKTRSPGSDHTRSPYQRRAGGSCW